MSDLNITVRDNGPLLVKGPLTLQDADGNAFTTNEMYALCRCGHSSAKPFCDGQHKAKEFTSTPRVEA